MTEPLTIHVDLRQLSYAQLADALERAGVDDLATATGAAQLRVNAAIAASIRQQVDPSFTYEDALALPVGSITVEADDPGKQDPAPASGATQQPSDALGESPPVK